MSINEAFQGKRFKTKRYKEYREELFCLLPKISIGQEELCLDIEFGFSSSRSDIDNCIKPFLDALTDKYGVDDRYIYELNVKKTIVKKGNEFIKFNFKTK
jgi:Holliday junction resolvase RusA-like endonuclease